MLTKTGAALPKLSTGIPGLDHIADGGLPRGRSTLLIGSAGSGKTVFSLQFLWSGIRDYGEGAVLVTFEERPADLLENVGSFGWALEEQVDRGMFAIVDGSPELGEEVVASGRYDLAALLARIESAVRKVSARRVVLEALASLFSQIPDPELVRRELHKIIGGLRSLGVTTLLTMEGLQEGRELGRWGIEEFVADNVIVLRNRLEQEKRRRTVEILKFRGTTHRKGEYPFTIDSQHGVTVLPMSAIELTQKSSALRLSSGVAALDRMCDGGWYRQSVVLVSGATGTGKTLMSMGFIKAAIAVGERVLLIAAEESRDQLRRNAAAWSIDLDAAEEAQLLRVVCRYPEVMSLEDHLLHIKRDLEGFRPHRVVLDSMSAFERVASTQVFREFVIGLTSTIKALEMTGLITNTTAMLSGGESITETHISSITDTIVLLRYVEMDGEMRRGITVLKMRGTQHDKAIREYSIERDGMHIGAPFRGVHGILSGNPTYGVASEQARLAELFPSDPAA